MAYFEYKPTTPLFYYTGIDAFENIVRSKKLWLTDVTASNDPREVNLGREMFSAAINALTEDDIPLLNRRDLAAFLADVLRFSRTSTCYTVCFALAGDELPMWREYATGGSGVSIAFRPTAMNAMPGRMQLVRYADETTPAVFRDAAIRAALTMGKPRSVSAILAASEAFATFTSLKHRTWAYEREVRMIFNQRDEKPDPNEILTQMVSAHPDGSIIEWAPPLTRESRGRTVKYFEFPFGRHTKNGPDPRRAIEHILLGPKCAMSAAEVTAILEAEGYEGFTIKASDCQIQ
ncbi:DUF2971 domain-containing protein [Devosia elaeis]|uniref:DUF2971 domain-containing protein n=1 Tax=Devosia elaeis TaxID=1770058 RepID=A0A178I4A3_9HYPH|nr:DUF2971 domain-containing protein [Devosia elaeis]OAM79015.1 hypothetical protein A3840_04125 [Devosia elaeis]